MGPLTIILGSQLEKKAGKIRLVTPKGDVLSIVEKDVVAAWAVDAAGDLKRYALADNAVVTVEVNAAALRGLDFASHSILKWCDDIMTSPPRDKTIENCSM